MNINLYKKLEKFVLTGNKGKPNYSSINQPFFMQNESNSNNDDLNLSNVNKILNDIPLSNELKIIYQIIGNETIEYYFNNWTLMSLNDLNIYYKMKKQQNQNRVIDFALSYLGLGYILIVSYDSITNKIYYRLDGGSNGYDREFNNRFIIKYKPKKEDGFLFDNWIKNIENLVDVNIIKKIN